MGSVGDELFPDGSYSERERERELTVTDRRVRRDEKGSFGGAI